MSRSVQKDSTKKQDINMILSPIKRDKLKRKLQIEEKERMRKSLPVLNSDEIRRYRLPYEMALIMELEEKGYPSAAAFLQQILNYHAALCAEHGPDSIVSSRPKLQETHGHLDRLYNGFINAEAAHYDGKISREIDELLHLSILFGLGSDDWWWLGEQLLIQSVNVSTSYQGDGGEREAISRFIFGKFLVENLKDVDRAIEHLDISRQLSLGKHWTAFRILKQKQKSVFMETCGLLSDCYLKLAYGQFYQNNDIATKLCLKAILRAQEACEYKKVAEANLMHGRCDMNANRFKNAISSFQKAFNLYKRMKMIDESCETRIQLALALLASGNFIDSAYHLHKLLDYANANNQTTYMAKAYRYLGEYYLNNGSPHISTPILLLSMRMFHKLNDIFNREQLKNLAAVSQGQEALPYYIQLVSTSHGTPEAPKLLQKLLAWKDLREPFWPKSLESSDNLKERLAKDGLGAGMIQDGYNDNESANSITTEDKEFMAMTKQLNIPIAADISMLGDGPIQITKEDEEQVLGADDEINLAGEAEDQELQMVAKSKKTSTGLDENPEAYSDIVGGITSDGKTAGKSHGNKSDVGNSLRNVKALFLKES